MSEHSVVVVEDDPPTRRYLSAAVDSCPDLCVVGSVESVADGIECLRREAPDLLLVDLALPDGSGLDLIREARRLSADTQSLVITVFGDEKTVVSAIEAGARGYLLKDATAGEVAKSLLDLLDGGSPISPQIARYLLARFQKERDESDGAAATPRLSARELEVLELVVKGFTFGEIATGLDVKTSTVKTHVRRIYHKLEVRSRAEAAYEALQLGLVKMD